MGLRQCNSGNEHFSATNKLFLRVIVIQITVSGERIRCPRKTDAIPVRTIAQASLDKKKVHLRGIDLK